MTPEESRRDEAARWLAQGRKDINAARLLASEEPSRSVFHSQQAAEKAAKAFSHLAMYHSAEHTT
jgi:HEPN domain-containing protein